MYKVYELLNGIFCTSNVEPSDYLRSWEVTEEQNELITNGADMFVENEELVIHYTIEDEPFAELISE